MLYATNRTAGKYGWPGAGVFDGHERKEVTNEVAAQLLSNREFLVEAEGTDGLPYRDERGRITHLGYFGAVDSRFGYGSGGVSILRALTRLQIDAFVYPYLRDTVHTVDLPHDASRHLKNRFVPQVALTHCLPDSFQYCASPRRIGWSMWESSQIPNGTGLTKELGDWAYHVNRYCEHLFVPCPHNVELFRNCGVEVPITSVPYGIDEEVWPYVVRPERDTFTVLLYGDLNSRKAPLEAIEAFQRAFADVPKARLILKTQNSVLGQGGFGLPEFTDQRIIIINETYTRQQLNQLLYEADCFLWPSRGEGFGLPPLQALATGCPVVMTTHTGMGAYYDKRYFYPIKTLGLRPAPMGGEWYEPDVDDAAAQLLAVYNNREAALRKAKQGSAYVGKNFSLDAFARRLGDALEAIQ